MSQTILLFIVFNSITSSNFSSSHRAYLIIWICSVDLCSSKSDLVPTTIFTISDWHFSFIILKLERIDSLALKLLVRSNRMIAQTACWQIPLLNSLFFNYLIKLTLILPSFALNSLLAISLEMVFPVASTVLVTYPVSVQMKVALPTFDPPKTSTRYSLLPGRAECTAISDSSLGIFLALGATTPLNAYLSASSAELNPVVQLLRWICLVLDRRSGTLSFVSSLSSSRYCDQ